MGYIRGSFPTLQEAGKGQGNLGGTEAVQDTSRQNKSPTRLVATWHYRVLVIQRLQTQPCSQSLTGAAQVAHYPDHYRPMVCGESHRCGCHLWLLRLSTSGHAIVHHGSIAQRLPISTAALCGVTS